MEVSFFGGPWDGEASEVGELMPMMLVPTMPPYDFSGDGTAIMEFEVARYELVRDEDGPYYVCSDG